MTSPVPNSSKEWQDLQSNLDKLSKKGKPGEVYWKYSGALVGNKLQEANVVTQWIKWIGYKLFNWTGFCNPRTAEKELKGAVIIHFIKSNFKKMEEEVWGQKGFKGLSTLYSYRKMITELESVVKLKLTDQEVVDFGGLKLSIDRKIKALEEELRLNQENFGWNHEGLVGLEEADRSEMLQYFEGLTQCMNNPEYAKPPKFDTIASDFYKKVSDKSQEEGHKEHNAYFVKDRERELPYQIAVGEKGAFQEGPKGEERIAEGAQWIDGFLGEGNEDWREGVQLLSSQFLATKYLTSFSTYANSMIQGFNSDFYTPGEGASYKLGEEEPITKLRVVKDSQGKVIEVRAFAEVEKSIIKTTEDERQEILPLKLVKRSPEVILRKGETPSSWNLSLAK